MFVFLTIKLALNVFLRTRTINYLMKIRFESQERMYSIKKFNSVCMTVRTRLWFCQVNIQIFELTLMINAFNFIHHSSKSCLLLPWGYLRYFLSICSNTIWFHVNLYCLLTSDNIPYPLYQSHYYTDFLCQYRFLMHLLIVLWIS